jgi:hypothetical protein
MAWTIVATLVDHEGIAGHHAILSAELYPTRQDAEAALPEFWRGPVIGASSTM